MTWEGELDVAAQTCCHTRGGIFDQVAVDHLRVLVMLAVTEPRYYEDVTLMIHERAR